MKTEDVILKKTYDKLLCLNKKKMSIKEAYYISSCVRLDKKTTNKILKELESKGYIKIVHNTKEIFLLN